MNDTAARTTAFNDLHVDALRACLDSGDNVEWDAAKIPSRLAEHINLAELAGRLPKDSEPRADLLQAAAASPADMEALAWRILAWGGMRVNNGKALANCTNDWLDVCADIAAGRYDRAEAYDAFARLRRDKKAKGLGAAYFTKLIYFLMPRDGRPIGYIMDQWVACSVNLLSAEPIVKIRPVSVEGDKDYVVTDRNNGTIYEHYCRAIEALAERCGLAPEALEMQLMSQGGRNPARWRAHVLVNRRPNP